MRQAVPRKRCASRLPTADYALIGSRTYVIAPVRLGNVTVVNPIDGVGQVPRFIEAVGDVQRRDTGFAAQVPEQLVHLATGRVVERREWLVQAQRLGTERQRSAQRHTLPFAATESVGRAIEQMFDLQQPRQFARRGRLAARAASGE